MRNARWTLLVALLAGCTTTNSTTNRQALNAGYQSLAAKDYEAAMARASEFLQRTPAGPGSAEALYLQGRVYEQRAQDAALGREAESKSDLQQAMSTYQRALLLSPPAKVDALVRAGVANVAYFQEDYPTAMQKWAEAYENIQQPDAKAWILYRIGLCQQRLGRFDQADNSFAIVRHDYPGSEPAQRAGTHYGARAFYVQVGAYTDAGNADNMVRTLQSQGFKVGKAIESGGKQAVRVGPAQTYAEAKSLRERLIASYPGALIEP
jgi:tetratricopeptide (TPR) repeat protein